KTSIDHSKKTTAGKVQRNGKRIKYERKNKIPQPTSNVWYIAASCKDKIAHKHPARFPEELIRKHIESWSNKGDIVLDYFSGSGTTAKMAMLMARNYIGCDISKEYVDLANERLGLYKNA